MQNPSFAIGSTGLKWQRVFVTGVSHLLRQRQALMKLSQAVIFFETCSDFKKYFFLFLSYTCIEY